jgi:hypothetical protein
MGAADSVNEICTLRIELCDSDPLIWRQLEVPTSISLKTLHDIIQAAMGWLDYHLWEFTIGERRYGLPMDEDWGTEPRIEASKVRLRKVLTAGQTVMTYVYDFGDDWIHRLILTNVRPGEAGIGYPRYVAGERDCSRGCRTPAKSTSPSPGSRRTSSTVCWLGSTRWQRTLAMGRLPRQQLPPAPRQPMRPRRSRRRTPPTPSRSRRARPSPAPETSGCWVTIACSAATAPMPPAWRA